LASGDVVSNFVLSIASGTVDIQPAAGVTVMINYLTCDTANGICGGVNEAGVPISYIMHNLDSSGSDTTNVQNWIDKFNLRLFMNNTQFIYLGTSSGAIKFSYGAIEL
jgi:hypothetical protein